MKKHVKTLSFNKKRISNLSSISLNGGGEKSERRTNCEFCPKTHHPCISLDGCPQSGNWTCHNSCAGGCNER